MDEFTWEGSIPWLFCKYDITNIGRRFVEARSPADANDTIIVRPVAWLRLRNIAIAARLQELLYDEL